MARSLPARGAWIEMQVHVCDGCRAVSLPARGAWIEITQYGPPPAPSLSLPARGAWIEIFALPTLIPQLRVAPRKGSVD